jgi:hypothetical protein
LGNANYFAPGPTPNENPIELAIIEWTTIEWTTIEWTTIEWTTIEWSTPFEYF